MLKQKRKILHKRVRRKISGSKERPRVAVFKSSQHIYVQMIDDISGKTLIAESDLALKTGTKTEKALKVGEALAKNAVKKKIKKVIFDRGGYKYHGRVASLADGLRKGGVEF